MSGQRLILWQEVPSARRVDEARLRRSMGADDPHWLRRRLRILAQPKCMAAAPFADGLYMPCLLDPISGSAFCRRHWAQRFRRTEELSGESA